MQVSLLLLYENVSLKNVELRMKTKPGPGYNRIRLLLPEELEHMEEDTLYADIFGIFDPEKIRGAEKYSIMTTAEREWPGTENGMTVQSGGVLLQLFGEVCAVRDRFCSWSEQTAKALSLGEDVETVLNLCAQVTKNTVYLTDAGLKMYAYSTPTLMFEISAVWNYQTKYRYMPINVMNELIASGEWDAMNHHRKAFTYRKSTFNNPYVCQNMFDQGAVRGRVFIVCIYSHPNQTCLEIAEELGRLFSVLVFQDPFFSTKSQQIYENFFQDVMENRIGNEDMIRRQINIFSWNMTDRYFVVTVDTTRQQPEQIRYIIDDLAENLKECKAFGYQEYVVALFHPGDTEKKELLQKMNRFLVKYGLKGVASKNYQDIRKMKIYFKQTKMLLQYGKSDRNKNLFMQEELGLHSVFHACLENHDAYELCHSDIIYLDEYDKKHATQLLETLFQYLLNDENAVKAAEQLYIHRNTMNYRLTRIRELLPLSERDSGQKFYYLLSIFLLKHQNQRKNE